MPEAVLSWKYVHQISGRIICFFRPQSLFVLARRKNFRFLSYLFTARMELPHFLPDSGRYGHMERPHRNVNIGFVPNYADATWS
jgi:hypothetical protein